MLTRRDLLGGVAAAGLADGLAHAQAAPASSPDAALDGLFDQLFQEDLRLRPESATQLGLDKGRNADLRSKLSDQSAEGIAAARTLTSRQLAALQAVNRSRLSPGAQVDYDTVLYTRRSSASLQRFDFGGTSYGPSPYAVSQLTGAYQSVPDFLDTKHKIETAADADAYLARLEAFGAELDANTERSQTRNVCGPQPATTRACGASVRVQPSTRRPCRPRPPPRSAPTRCTASGWSRRVTSPPGWTASFAGRA